MAQITLSEIEEATKGLPLSKFRELHMVLPREADGGHTKEFLAFANATDLPPMTNTQAKFAKWLLLPENAAQLEKIGDLESVFKAVRRHVKTRKHEPGQPV